MHAEAIPHTPDVNLGPFPLSGGAPKELRPPKRCYPPGPRRGVDTDRAELRGGQGSSQLEVPWPL